MRSVLRNGGFEVTFNKAFAQVIRECSEVPRPGQEGTWLVPEMIDAYVDFHKQGFAHSVEVWQEGQLVGGLYGVGLGKMFFGESMFARVSNASKVGFIHLIRRLEELEVQCIDCQQETQHLMSLGATTISASAFYEIIRGNLLNCLTREKMDLTQS